MQHENSSVVAMVTLLLCAGCSGSIAGGSDGSAARSSQGPARFEGDWLGEWRTDSGQHGSLRATFLVQGIDVQGSIDFDGTDCFDYSDFFGYADGETLRGEVSWLDYLGPYNEADLDGVLTADGNRIAGTLSVTGGDCAGATASFTLRFAGPPDG
ncbi:MAG: hypothetical protein KDC98_26275 [Planctomycetes bacterium]|nr:hypothetical protein [Planctomycetota bacterium]